MSHPTCNRCEKEVSVKWKYCRFCGNELTIQREIEEEPVSNIQQLRQEEHTVEEEIPFDKDDYYKVLSTRAERSIIMKRKDVIKKEITVLLERLQSGLIDEEMALPEVKKLRIEVQDINKESKKYSDIADELPVEVLNDQIHDAKSRIKKINKLKEDEDIDVMAIKEAKARAEQSLELLKDQQSKIFGYLRTWKRDLEQNVDMVRKEIQQLTIRFKTDEITEESFETKKRKLVKSIENDEEVLQSLMTILQ